MDCDEQRRKSDGPVAALAWVVNGRRPEFVQARLVAFLVEFVGLNFFPGARKYSDLCAQYGIPPRSLNACRAEVRQFMRGAFKRTLADDLAGQTTDSLPIGSKVEGEPDKFFDEH